MNNSDIEDILNDNHHRVVRYFNGDIRQSSFFMGEIMLKTTWTAVEGMKELERQLSRMKQLYDKGELKLNLKDRVKKKEKS